MRNIDPNLAESKPLFSVIIPVHNKAEYLERSLSYVYEQTFNNFEIIAIDDSSTDGSLEILRRHEGEGKLRLYQRNVPGPGGYAARNLGVSKALADWVVFFDADDIMYPDHLKNLAGMMMDYPGLRFYCANYERRVGGRAAKKAIDIPTGKYGRLEGLKFFSRDDFFHMNSACTQVSFFEELGGFPAGLYRRGGDIYFWVKLLTRVDIFAYSDEVTTVWCVDNSSVTRNPANLSLHPLADFLGREAPCLDAGCDIQLRKIINRKVISWAAEKKSQGKRCLDDFPHISIKGLGCRDALRVLSLSMPLRIYKIAIRKKRELVG